MVPGWEAAPRRTAICSMVLYQNGQMGEDNGIRHFRREALFPTGARNDFGDNVGIEDTVQRENMARVRQAVTPQSPAVRVPSVIDYRHFRRVVPREDVSQTKTRLILTWYALLPA